MGAKAGSKRCLRCGRPVVFYNVVLEPVGYQCVRCFFAMEYWDGNVERMEETRMRYRNGGAWKYPPDGAMLVVKDL